MARKSKRKSRAINWNAVLWTTLIANILLAVLFSPLTSIRRLRVMGAESYDQDRISNLAKTLDGKPFALVPTVKFEGSVLGSRDVQEATLSHNLFGSAILRLTYRRPVAMLASVPHTYLDEQGVIYGSPVTVPGIRQLAIAPEYMQPGVALTLPWPSQVVAELCPKLDTFSQLKDYVVHLDTTGRLLISGEGTCKIDLGGSDHLDEKLGKLRHFLEDDPQLLDRLESLSLVEPSNPALITKKGNTK